MIELSNSAAETSNLGLKLAKNLRGGEIYGLVGELGSGKTCFAKGFARGLGIKRVVQSPSFILMKVYDIKGVKGVKNFCHVDVYRLSSTKELLEVGLGEYLGRKDAVTLIEWADKIKKILLDYPVTYINFIWLNKNKRRIIINKPQ